MNKEHITKLAKHTYEKYDPSGIPWEKAGRNQESYLREAEDELKFAHELFTILGASPEKTDSLITNFTNSMKHSTQLMQENKELKFKLDQHNESIRDMKKKQKSHTQHVDVESDCNDALEKADAEIQLLQTKNNILITEATKTATELKKLKSVQAKNKTLIEERDALELALEHAGKDSTPEMDDSKAEVLSFLNGHGVKAGKRLISSALGETSVVQAKASAGDWVDGYIRKYGMKALLKACESS